MKSLMVLIGAFVFVCTTSCNVQRKSSSLEKGMAMRIAPFSTKENVWYKKKGAQDYSFVNAMKGKLSTTPNVKYEVMGVVSDKALTVHHVLSKNDVVVSWEKLIGKWQFTYVKDSNADAIALSKMQVNVTEKGLSGNLACNRFSCSVNMSGTSFVVGSIPTTKRMCYKMDIERATLVALRTARQIEAYDNKIELYAEGEMLLSMVRLK